MFPGDPCHAFLMDANSLAENTLVTAHVLGHADFSKNNQLFARFHEMAGGNIVEQAAAHAHRIEQAIDDHGQERVEAVLDAALALESHIDVDRRAAPRRATPNSWPREDAGAAERRSSERFRSLPGDSRGARARRAGPLRAPRAAAPGIRPALVHRALRARARALGARHLPRGARGVALLLPGVRLPDHERGLGVVLARAPAARGRLPAAGPVPRRRSRRTPTWCGRSPRASRPRSPSTPTTSASRCGSTSSSKHGLEQARAGAARGGRLRLHPQLSRPRAGREARPVRLRGARRTARSRSPAATSTRCARRSSRRSSTSARRASPRSEMKHRRQPGARARAHERRPRPRRRRARGRCSSTRSACGAARCACTRSTTRGEPVELAA